MENFDYVALKGQLLAQGIALQGLNFRVVDELDPNSRDSNDEPSDLGSETVSPVTVREGQAQSEERFEFGQSLEGDLIELMKDYRCVWDVSCRAFKEYPKKQQAWKEIAMKLKQDENTLKKTWKNLRDNLSKCMKKRNLLTRSGAGATELPQCKFFKELQFIKDTISNRATRSNLTIPQPSLVETSGEMECVEDTSNTESGIMYSTPERMHSPAETPQIKRKRVSGPKERQETCKDEQSSTNALDGAISEYLCQQNSQKKDADNMFCQSLVSILSSLPAKKNRKAKIEIQKLSYDIEFSED